MTTKIFITHIGNGNVKRKTTACGVKASIDDSIDPEKVNCITCIEKLLERQHYKNSKTAKWEGRLSSLRPERAS